MLRRIFRHKKEEITGGWRKLYNEEIQSLHPSFNIIRMIKSKMTVGRTYSSHRGGGVLY
jgi:hypothetical protein